MISKGVGKKVAYKKEGSGWGVPPCYFGLQLE